MLSRRRDERGAVAIMVGAISLALIMIAAFAVDLGVQRVARRDMQALADIVALDLVRELDGTRTVAELMPLMPDLARESQERNESTIGETPELDVELGELNTDGEFVVLTGTAIPTAVRVTSATSVGFAFVPGSGRATRSAVAQQASMACFKVGSFALGLASNDSVLSPILGDAAAARVLSYGGLVTADVSLLGLAAELAAGTPDDLLTASNISVGEFLDASAALLTQEGGTANLALATAIGEIKTDLGPLASEIMDFGELLSLGQGNNSALDAQINVLDLLTGGLIVANGVNGVAVPDFNLSVLGTTLQAKLWITEAPRFACNRGIATTAQGYVELSGTINLSVLGIGVRLRNVALRISLANASARLADDSAACDPESLNVEVFDQTLANVRLQAIIQLVLLLVWADVGFIDTGAPGAAPGNVYELPLPESYTTRVSTDSGTIGLDLSNADVTVVGLDIGALVAALAPLVNGVSSLLTNTLLPALGITTAGADLWALPEVTCANPSLVG